MNEKWNEWNEISISNRTKYLLKKKKVIEQNRFNKIKKWNISYFIFIWEYHKNEWKRIIL